MALAGALPQQAGLEAGDGDVNPQHRHQVKYLMDIFNICCEIASDSTLALV